MSLSKPYRKMMAEAAERLRKLGSAPMTPPASSSAIRCSNDPHGDGKCQLCEHRPEICPLYKLRK